MDFFFHNYNGPVSFLKCHQTRKLFCPEFSSSSFADRQLDVDPVSKRTAIRKRMSCRLSGDRTEIEQTTYCVEPRSLLSCTMTVFCPTDSAFSRGYIIKTPMLVSLVTHTKPRGSVSVPFSRTVPLCREPESTDKLDFSWKWIVTIEDIM